MEPTSKQVATQFVVDEIREMRRGGATKIKVEQAQRLLPDIISVDGKWYPVVTSQMHDYRIRVVDEDARRFANRTTPDNTRWLDDLGRVI